MPTPDPPRRQPPWDDENDAVPLPDGHPWTPQERWAWARIIRGFVAEMSDYGGPRENFASFAEWLKGKDDGAGFQANAGDDQGNLTVWPDHRILTNTFLRLILFNEPWAGAPSQPWVRIASARIEEKLVWSAHTFNGELWFDRCRFTQDLSWAGLRIEGTLSLTGSRFEGAFGCDRLQTAGGLFCSEAMFVSEKEARIPGARIGSNASFTGAFARGGLNCEGAEIGGDLLCRDKFHSLGPVRLLGARIGADLSFSNAKLDGPIGCDGIDIKGAFFCRATVATQKFRFLGGRIAGIATFVEATIEGLNGDSIEIGRDLFLRDAKRLGDIVCVGARIGGDVQLSDSFIDGEINFTNARIEGELQTAQHPNSSPKWSQDARLILRNARLGALAGGAQSFPKRVKGRDAPMDLTGMTYERLGGLGAERAGSLAKAKVKELHEWLAAGHAANEFTPGPYQTLAHALTDAGQSREADRVLYAMRSLEARCEKNIFRKLWLKSFGFFIGYGFESWRAFLLFLLLVGSGAAFGLNVHGVRAWMPTPGGWDEFLRWLGFSLGNAIPLVSLDKAHEDFLAHAFGGGEPLHVPIPIAWAYYGQKIAGFVILSYLAAGVSGFASRRGG